MHYLKITRRSVLEKIGTCSHGFQNKIEISIFLFLFLRLLQKK